jgi:hypothetical protein
MRLAPSSRSNKEYPHPQYKSKSGFLDVVMSCFECQAKNKGHKINNTKNNVLQNNCDFNSLLIYKEINYVTF